MRPCRPHNSITCWKGAGDWKLWYSGSPSAIGRPIFTLLNSPNICLGHKLTSPQDTLTYSCVCENGVSPNITQYSQTLPFFICQEWGNQCVNNCNGDNTCANSCRADHPCGAQSPYLGNATSSSSSSSASATASATTSRNVVGFGGQTGTSAAGGSTGAAHATFVPNAAIGAAVLFSSVFLGFAVLL